LWHIFKEAKLSLYVHIVVIAGLVFSQTALLPAQDVSSGAQTHLGAAHTHFGSCYACSGLVMNSEPITSPKLAGHGPKVCLGIIHLFGGKKKGLGKGQIKKKRLTATMCIYHSTLAISTQFH